MSKELIKEMIVIDQCIGKESTQLLLEGDIIVPDIKPDIALILQTDARICIEKTDISANRVNFMGKLELKVLYLAKSSDHPVHNITMSFDIDDFINIDGAAKDMWVTVTAELINIDIKIINDRKMNYKAVISAAASVENSVTHNAVINIDGIPENQLLKGSLQIDKSIENKADSFNIKEQLPLPSGRANIKEILQCSAVIGNRDVKVQNGRVSITGEIIVTTLYIGDSDDSLIEFMENELPFNGAIEVTNAREDMFADAELALLHCKPAITADADGEDRLIDIEISIGVTMKVHSQATMEYLEDAYCINNMLNITKTALTYPRLVCRNRNQNNIKEIISLDDGCPEMLQIFRVKGRSHVDTMQVADDRILADGIIEINILYVAKSDNDPLYSFNTVLPFHQIIETKGTNPAMEVKLTTAIEHVTFNMLSGTEVELRLLISFNSQVIEMKQCHMITDIEFSEMDRSLIDNMPTMIIYVVQKDDTLWKIAKRYNTEINELLAVNEIDKPASITAGQKLLILKKSFEN